MKKLLLIVMLALMPWTAKATEGQENTHFGVGAGFDFSEDAYEFDLHFAWYPVETFGLRASIAFAGEYSDLLDKIVDRWHDDDDYYYYDYGRDYTWRFKFSPSIELRSPAIIKFNSDANLRLFANPGVTLSPGAPGSRGAKWFTWQVRGGIEFNFSIVSLQLGYRCTNFYLYSGNPYSGTEYEPDRDLFPNRYTHSGFASITCHF